MMPEFSRIKPGNKWLATNSTQQGKSGTVVYIGDQPEANADGWVEQADGLFYLPGRKLPAQVDLVRDHGVRGTDYVTSTGVTLTIPIAALSARKISFSSGQANDYATVFARKAFALFDKLASDTPVMADDPDLFALICEAVMQVYYVTPELLDELQWITTADVDPIVVCLMGASPKVSKPAGAR